MRNGVVGLLLLAPVVAWAQKVPVIALKPADAKLEEEFTSIGSVRELRDGRVLITDQRESRIVVADLKTGAVEPVGRQGRGPNEFGSAAPLRAIGGDSSLLSDFMNRRVLLLDGTRIVVTIPPDAAVMTATRGLITGADRFGFVLSTAQSPPQERSGITTSGPADSSTIVRVARATGHVDTVARLRAPKSRRMVVTDATGKVTSSAFALAPLAAGEQVALFTDGWIGIARIEPYRVDWRMPNGRIIHGAPLPVPVEKFDARERKAWEDRNPRTSRETMPRELRDLIESSASDWPTTIPPFPTGTLIAAADGTLLIRRTLTADRTTMCYDVVDRAGKLLGQIQLEKGERIIGFGSNSVYVVWADDDDIQRLRRHPWPAEKAIKP